MASSKLLGLPPVPAELKPILPFLQRAEELKGHEPIIAYWCAYHAAQVGINLRARNDTSRVCLSSLLGVLERMKRDIGSVDAIEIESASAAFVENFALRVFQSADNEDRRGAATRTTAKKFLAASNFLEVLKVFPKADISESNEEKIRYAKWKAADIAKAFREGRKPVSGPAGQEADQEAQEPTMAISQIHVDVTPPSARNPSPPHAHIDFSHHPPAHILPSVATHDVSYGSPPRAVNMHRRDGSGSSTHSGGRSSSPRQSAMKAPGREGSPEGKKRVHFSSSADVLPITPDLPAKPPSPAEAYQGPPSIYAAPPEPTSSSPSTIPQFDALPSSHSPPRSNIYAEPTVSVNGHSSSPPRAYVPAVPPSPPPTLPPQVELTPQLISKVQKHCRFAISSLDYEDAERAKQELRAALALLGSP